MPSQSSVLLQICDIFDPSEHQQFLAECWRLDTPSKETQFEGTREKIVSLVSHLVSVLKSKKIVLLFSLLWSSRLVSKLSRLSNLYPYIYYAHPPFPSYIFTQSPHYNMKTRILALPSVFLY